MVIIEMQLMFRNLYNYLIHVLQSIVIVVNSQITIYFQLSFN